ncbi:uncharacterized protein BDV17DRAFT_206781 [Aspergillus undulatus]|uniref:uncharacterized protein n=1 Tax=Aspergillus undulatus TaxID=1810928 RepID=UPI003CCD1A6B
MASITTQRAHLSQLHARLPLSYLQPISFLQQHRHRHPLHFRYASRRVRPKPSRSSTTNQTATSPPLISSTLKPDDVNPPASTRPAELGHLPSRDEAGNLGKWLFALGRAYLAFYKTGFKNVYHNYRASLAIRRDLGIPSSLPTIPHPQRFYKRGAEVGAATTRSNMQLVNRAAYDVRRMLPFGMILLVFGEFTPLLIGLLGTAVTPYTCRLPKQLEKDRVKRTRVKYVAMNADRYVESEPGSQEELDELQAFVNLRRVNGSKPREVLRACAVFGIIKSYRRPEVLVNLLYRRKLQRHAEYLALDDQMIRDAGGVKAMEAAEVRIAVEERGGFGLPRGTEEWEAERIRRQWLEMWLMGPRHILKKYDSLEARIKQDKEMIRNSI